MLHQNVYVILVAEDAVALCTVERGREIGTCLRLVFPLQQDGAATLKNSLPATADKVHGTQTVKEIGDAHQIYSHQRSGECTIHQTVHFPDCDFFQEEAGIIDAVGEQWHILGSDCTREFLFPHSIYGGGSECFRILLSVIMTFCIDLKYHFVYVRSFQRRPGKELFYKVCPFHQEDSDSPQCLAVDVLVCHVSVFIMVAVDELQGEHPRCHYACGYIVLILSVRFQQQLAQAVHSCITINGPRGKLSRKKKE